MPPNGSAAAAHPPQPAAVNRKKQKRREKEAAKKAAQDPAELAQPLHNGTSPALPAARQARPAAPQYAEHEHELDEPQYDDDAEFSECLRFVANAPEAARAIAKAGRGYALEEASWATVLDNIEASLQTWATSPEQ